MHITAKFCLVGLLAFQLFIFKFWSRLLIVLETSKSVCHRPDSLLNISMGLHVCLHSNSKAEMRWRQRRCFICLINIWVCSVEQRRSRKTLMTLSESTLKKMSEVNSLCVYFWLPALTCSCKTRLWQIKSTDSLTFIHSDVKKKKNPFRVDCKTTVVLFFKGAMCSSLNQFVHVNCCKLGQLRYHQRCFTEETDHLNYFEVTTKMAHIPLLSPHSQSRALITVETGKSIANLLAHPACTSAVCVCVV